MSHLVTEQKVGSPARMDSPSSTVASHHLNATSIGSAAANRIKGRRRVIGRVHSIFSGAIDVTLRGGSMISIVREEVGSGPINIVTDLPRGRSMAELGVKKNAEVLKKDGEILIGGTAVLVSIQHAKLYRTEKEFPTKPGSISEIRANVVVVARTVARRGHHQGLGGLIPLLVPSGTETKHPTELNSFSRLALPRVRSLISKIREGRISELGTEVQNLAGLGPGLTPSGDDMLAGLMVTLTLIAHNLKGDAEMVRRVNRKIALNARKRTTTLSEEVLSQAARGETNEHFQELIKKTLTALPNEAQRSAELVLKIGETSGTDTVLGILLGFQLSLDEKSAVGVV